MKLSILAAEVSEASGITEDVCRLILRVVPDALATLRRKEMCGPELTLEQLAVVYEDGIIQRNQVLLRLLAAAEGMAKVDRKTFVANHSLLRRLNGFLEDARRQMESRFSEHPLYDFLMGVPGINRCVACRIIGKMRNPSRFTDLSHLRSFAGLAPGRDRLVKGTSAVFSVQFRTVLHVAGDSLIKSCTRTKGKLWAPAKFYEDIYRKWAEKYFQRHADEIMEHWNQLPGPKPFHRDVQRAIEREYNDPEFAWPYPQLGADTAWPPKRRHLAAMRKMLDVLLYHVWTEWHKALGQEDKIKVPYVHERLGHHMMYEATDFSSPLMAERKKKREAAHVRNVATRG